MCSVVKKIKMQWIVLRTNGHLIRLHVSGMRVVSSFQSLRNENVSGEHTRTSARTHAHILRDSAETHLVITVMISPAEKDYWKGFGERSLSAPHIDMKHTR